MTTGAARNGGVFLPLFLYWGRRGFSRFVLDLARQAEEEEPDHPVIVSVSRANELFAEFEALPKVNLVPVDTFSKSLGVIMQAWRIPSLRRDFCATLNTLGVTHVIDMMPHIWMPYVQPAIQRSGARYICIAHDAQVHPGDFRTLVAQRAIGRSLAEADHVVTLSQSVADGLLAARAVSKDRLSTLFLPDLRLTSAMPQASRVRHSPPRLLFLGRIMPYKGLPLFVETVERLSSAGFPVSCGVFGEGAMDNQAAPLAACGAEVVNRWLSEDEIAEVLSRYDVLIASHTEASQSGVVAAALGAGLPVIATPVGGLAEQIRDGETGIIADDVSADALGRAIRRLFLSPGLYELLRENIAASSASRSTSRFYQALLRTARAVG
jgi:glycosyltransferase involved in cell wall biosynthesis